MFAMIFFVVMRTARGLAMLSLVALLGAVLFSASCSKKKPVAVAVPPPPDYLQLGEKYFDSADYTNALRAYDTYLAQGASVPRRDTVLFHMALAYAFPQSPVRNLQKATQLFQELSSLTGSAYSAQAQFVLSLLDGMDRLKLDVSKRDEQLKQREDLIKQRDEQLKQRDEQIRQLTRELNKLKQIDMERRPIRPAH